MTIELYYYNKEFTRPIIFFLVKINSHSEEKFLENNANYMFNILIENKLAKDSDVLIFNIIKEHEAKIINWILPCINTNVNFTRKLEKDRDLLNKIITETVKNSSCETVLEIKNYDSDKTEIRVKDCDMNLSFITDIYF